MVFNKLSHRNILVVKKGFFDAFLFYLIVQQHLELYFSELAKLLLKCCNLSKGKDFVSWAYSPSNALQYEFHSFLRNSVFYLAWDLHGGTLTELQNIYFTFLVIARYFRFDFYNTIIFQII